MKKVYKCFAVSEIIHIFAPAIIEKTSGNALFDILHDRLNSSLVKQVLYPDEGSGLSYYICDTGFPKPY